MRRAVVFCTIFCLFACAVKQKPVPKIAKIVFSDIRQVPQKIKDMVVFVISEQTDGTKIGGTGFAVAPNTVLTVCHLVDQLKITRTFIMIYRPDTVVVKLARNNAYSSWFKPEKNMCALEVDYRFLHFAMPGKDAELGERVFTLGYPLASFPKDRIGLHLVVARGYLYTRQHMRSGTVNTSIEAYDLRVTDGMYGSPVFNYRGEVIGMVLAAGPFRIKSYSFAWSVDPFRGEYCSAKDCRF